MSRSYDIWALTLLLVSTAIIVACAVVGPGIEITGKGSADAFLGFWGGVLGGFIGGAMTLIAAAVAWYIAWTSLTDQRRAMSISVLSSERDLIRRETPGLIDAGRFMTKIRHTLREQDPNQTVQLIDAFIANDFTPGRRFHFKSDDVARLITEQLQRTPELERERIISAIGMLRTAIGQRVVTVIMDGKTGVDWSEVERAARSEIDQIEQMLRERVKERLATLSEVDTLLAKEIAASLKSLGHHTASGSAEASTSSRSNRPGMDT